MERIVVDRAPSDQIAVLRFQDGSTHEARRYIPVGIGDTLLQKGNESWVAVQDGVVKVEPSWRKIINVTISGKSFPLMIKEIESTEELDGYLRLTRFHYRGQGGAGRRVPLVATMDHWQVPPIVGFVELSSSFLVSSARDRVLDAPFVDHRTGVSWPRWDRKASKKNGNCLVRISRCVVFPELRGLGFATSMVDAAVEYATERWHIGGIRPSFVEITADMLKYWPFVKRSGFLHVGDTEGNGHRAAKDMEYLLKKSASSKKGGSSGMPKGGGGILSMQRSYALHLAEVIKDGGLNVEQVIRNLRTAPERLTDEQWVQLHRVYRKPKPTYMRGIGPDAERFLTRRVRTTTATNGHRKLNKSQDKNVQNNPEPILSAKGLELLATSVPIPSNRARRVQEAFGIVATAFDDRILAPIDFEVRQGEIILIGGPSGSGKTLLLKALRRLTSSGRSLVRMPSGVTMKYLEKSNTGLVAELTRLQTRKSAIELLEELTLEDAMKVLAAAGLAEPSLYVVPVSNLSLGQKYRLRLALALAKHPRLIIADEFCEPLDTLSASAVCRRLRKATQQDGFGAVVATADPERVYSALQPDKLLLLASDGDSRWASTPIQMSN